MKTATVIPSAWLFCLLLGAAGVVQADPQEGHGPMMQPMHHGDAAGEYGHKDHWMADLDDKQRADMERIKADYMKKQLPLKARMKALKAELTALALADQPDQAATDKKIDEILELKRQMLRNKVDKISARRGVLNEAQRARYDIQVMKKASAESRHGREGMGPMGMMGPGMMGQGMMGSGMMGSGMMGAGNMGSMGCGKGRSMDR